MRCLKISLGTLILSSFSKWGLENVYLYSKTTSVCAGIDKPFEGNELKT